MGVFPYSKGLSEAERAALETEVKRLEQQVDALKILLALPRPYGLVSTC